MDDDWYNEYYLFDAGRASTSVAHGMQAGRFRHLSDDDKHDLLTVMARISERSFRRWFHQGAVGETHQGIRPAWSNRDLTDWRYQVSLDEAPMAFMWPERNDRTSAETLYAECWQDLRAVGIMK